MVTILSPNIALCFYQMRACEGERQFGREGGREGKALGQRERGRYREREREITKTTFLYQVSEVRKGIAEDLSLARANLASLSRPKTYV